MVDVDDEGTLEEEEKLEEKEDHAQEISELEAEGGSLYQCLSYLLVCLLTLCIYRCTFNFASYNFVKIKTKKWGI